MEKLQVYTAAGADHNCDEDCAPFIPAGEYECTACGAYRGDPCPTCGGCSFHRGDEDCEEVEAHNDLDAEELRGLRAVTGGRLEWLGSVWALSIRTRDGAFLAVSYDREAEALTGEEHYPDGSESARMAWSSREAVAAYLATVRA